MREYRTPYVRRSWTVTFEKTFLMKRGAKPAEAYGFAGWILSSVAFVAYLAWAYLPEDTLRREGITYFPDKAWALVIPAGLCLTVACVYGIYDRINRSMVPPLCSRSHFEGTISPVAGTGTNRPRCRTDRFKSKDEYTVRMDAGTWDCGEDAIPPLVDIPIQIVNQALYLDDCPLVEENLRSKPCKSCKAGEEKAANP